MLTLTASCASQPPFITQSRQHMCTLPGFHVCAFTFQVCMRTQPQVPSQASLALPPLFQGPERQPNVKAQLLPLLSAPEPALALHGTTGDLNLFPYPHPALKSTITWRDILGCLKGQHHSVPSKGSLCWVGGRTKPGGGGDPSFLLLRDIRN